MVETIRIYIQKRLQAKKEYIEKYDCSICPNIQGKLEKLQDQSRICIGSHAGGGKFEVRDMFGGRYAININDKTCSCRGWDLTGIPCIHGVCAIAGSGRNPEAYVHKYYSKEMFITAYKNILEPVKSPQFWPRTDKPIVNAPGAITLPGRPKRKRRKAPRESVKCAKEVKKLRRSGKNTLACRECGRDGHNMRTCPSKKKQQIEGETDPSAQSRKDVPTIPVENNGVSDIQVNQSEVENTMPVGENVVASIQANKPKKKMRCSVCLKEGHRRNKCDVPAAQIWRNMDFYAPNHQYIPLENEKHILAQEHVAPSMQSTTSGTCSTQNTTRIGAVPVAADFSKQGKQFVTLKSLQSAARSRASLGHAQSQSSEITANKTKD